MKVTVQERVLLFWNMDLVEVEQALGVVDPVNTLQVTEIDGRVPPRGSVLWDKLEYLPKEDILPDLSSKIS